ncbi:MAG: hypothetical protein ACXAEU_01705 [Candidatus Hodarchaeales archaeon]|jgi:hypothetical protein
MFDSTRQLVISLFPLFRETPDTRVDQTIDFYEFLQQIQRAGNLSFHQALILVLQSSTDEIVLLEVEQVLREFLPFLSDSNKHELKEELELFNHEVLGMLLNSELVDAVPA